MKILLAPAKTMRDDPDCMEYHDLPVFLEQTEEILAWLRERSEAELLKLWKCSRSLAERNMERLRTMDLRKRLTPAVLSYEGIVFQHMAPNVFQDDQFAYVQDHLRILSGFYGILKPMDGVTPYRLEMEAKASIGGTKNLYQLWGSRLYEELHDTVIVNLASKEYADAVRPYLRAGDRFVDITFCEQAGGRMVSKATYAKMARGEMVRYMAENQITDPEELKEFDRIGYRYRDDLSAPDALVFERQTAEIP